MNINNKTIARMRKLNLKIFVVNIDSDTVQTFEDWATENDVSISLFTSTEEIGDITEYAVVAEDEETARALACAEYYKYSVRMFLEDLDDEDFEEVSADAISEIIPTKEG